MRDVSGNGLPRRKGLRKLWVGRRQKGSASVAKERHVKVNRGAPSVFEVLNDHHADTSLEVALATQHPLSVAARTSSRIVAIVGYAPATSRQQETKGRNILQATTEEEPILTKGGTDDVRDDDNDLTAESVQEDERGQVSSCTRFDLVLSFVQTKDSGKADDRDFVEHQRSLDDIDDKTEDGDKDEERHNHERNGSFVDAFFQELRDLVSEDEDEDFDNFDKYGIVPTLDKPHQHDEENSTASDTHTSHSASTGSICEAKSKAKPLVPKVLLVPVGSTMSNRRPSTLADFDGVTSYSWFDEDILRSLSSEDAFTENPEDIIEMDSISMMSSASSGGLAIMPMASWILSP